MTPLARLLRHAGVRHVLVDGMPAAVPAAGRPAAAPPRERVPARTQAGARREAVRARAADPRPAPPRAPEPRPAPPVRTGLPDPSAWPAPWRDLLARSRRGRVAWTYYGLGHDLLGTPNDGRRERLAHLLRFLAMPAGTHTFWPVGLPSADGEGGAVLEPDAERFWEGLALLGARILVVMGSPAAGAAGIPGPLRPLTAVPRAVNGVRILVTWDVDLLDDPGRLAATGAFLRSALSGLL